MPIEPTSFVSIDQALEILDFMALDSSSFDPFDEQELASLEDFIGFRLPDDYRWFLANYGACISAAGSTQVTTQGKRYEVRKFFGKRRPTGLSLQMCFEDFEDLLEDNELPIADDLMGGRIMLNAQTNAVGLISRDGPTRTNSIADSFSDLIARLEPYQELTE